MQTSVHIEKCTPMFAWAAIGSIKHRYTLKNVNRFLRFENIEKTTFYLIQWEYPNSGSVISEIWPSCFEMGVNVTPPACGRRGTLTPHFSAYRAIFSDMTSPELGYCSSVHSKFVGHFTEIVWQSKNKGTLKKTLNYGYFVIIRRFAPLVLSL